MSIGADEKFSWITPYLLIGAEPAEIDLKELMREGVGAILNVKGSDSLRDAASRSGFEYAHIPLRNAGAPDYLELMRCCRFIDSQRALGKPVLVHCALGIGRSATVALAYVLLNGHSLGDALQLLRAGRPSVDPSGQQLHAAANFARDAARGEQR